MRLIDADALAKELMHEGLGYQYNRVINAPTVDAVPVRHGRWIPEVYDDMFCYCSECGTHEYKETIEALRYDYCPYCGAKMDAERKEE